MSAEADIALLLLRILRLRTGELCGTYRYHPL